VDLVDLRARSGDGPRLSLDMRRLVGQGAHLALPLGARPGGGDGDRPELVLRRYELLLECDVGGSEPLVVDEELLDVLVPGGEALLDEGEGRVRRGGARVLREEALIARGHGYGGRRGPGRPSEEGRVGIVKFDDVGPAPGCHRRRRRRLATPRGGLGGLVARLGEGSRGERGRGKKEHELKKGSKPSMLLCFLGFSRPNLLVHMGQESPYAAMQMWL
jgi:hypothetical protein